MTRQIQNQRLAAGKKNSSQHFSPAQTSEQQRAQWEVSGFSGHRASALTASDTQAKKKLIATVVISEIELSSGKYATKQFSSRNKNAFFGLLKWPETREKRSRP
jgi:hypothetical protein